MNPGAPSVLTAFALVVNALTVPRAGLSIQDVSRELVAAVESHQNGAPDAGGELRLVDELGQLGERSAIEWLPDFWAAYLLTQITTSHPEDRRRRLERAQNHLDRARERAVEDLAAPISDLHALQSLIHRLASTLAGDNAERKRIEDLEKAELQKAYALDPKSPVVMVHAATDLIQKGRVENDWSMVMGGLALLHQADERFGAVRQPRGLTSHYNSEWTRPWVDWVHKMYKDGFGAEGRLAGPSPGLWPGGPPPGFGGVADEPSPQRPGSVRVTSGAATPSSRSRNAATRR